MNRINPLYIVIACFLCAVLSFVLVQKEHNSLLQSNKQLVTFNQKVLLYAQMKKGGEPKTKLDRILKQSRFKSYITKKVKGKAVKIQFNASNKLLMQQFLNKIVNANLFIKHIEISATGMKIEVNL